jgi:hypothetical protein
MDKIDTMETNNLVFEFYFLRYGPLIGTRRCSYRGFFQVSSQNRFETSVFLHFIHGK